MDNNILFSLFAIGALYLYSAETASFDEFISRENVTSSNEFISEKYVLKPEEKVLVDEFRTTYSDLVLTDEYLNTDAFIGGLLEGNKWTLGEASRQLSTMVSWKDNDNIGALRNEDAGADLLQKFPWRVNATNHNGCPVLEIAWGSWLIAEYIQSQEFTRDGINNFNRHGDQMLERSRLATEALAPKCEKAMIIVDANGFLMKNIRSLNAFNAVTRLSLSLNNRYRKLFAPIIIINAPPDFAYFLKIIRPFLGWTILAYTVYSDKETAVAKRTIASYADLSKLSLITWPEEEKE